MVRDRLSQVVESTPLEQWADLRAVLRGDREARIADGWECEDIGSCVAFFFCRRGGVREMVSIERCPPPAVGKGWWALTADPVHSDRICAARIEVATRAVALHRTVG